MVPRQHCMQQCQRKCGMLGVNICLIVRFTTTPGGSAGQRTTRDCVRNSGSPQKPLLLQPICPLQINYHSIYMCTNVHHEYIYTYILTKRIFNFKLGIQIVVKHFCVLCLCHMMTSFRRNNIIYYRAVL